MPSLNRSTENSTVIRRAARSERADRPFLIWAITPNRPRLYACIVEDSSHEPRMRHTDAKPQDPGSVDVVDSPLELREHMLRPDIVRGDEICEAFDVITAPALPRHFPQVQIIVNTVVDERRQPMLIDRVPQSQFRGDAIVEPIQD